MTALRICAVSASTPTSTPSATGARPSIRSSVSVVKNVISSSPAPAQLDRHARELVERDAEVLDLLDVEAEPARDARPGQANDAYVLERGRHAEPDRSSCAFRPGSRGHDLALDDEVVGEAGDVEQPPDRVARRA